MSKKVLDFSLWGLTLVFMAFVVLANEDPGGRAAIFGESFSETTWHVKAIYKALYDVGIGGLVSLLFYVLLVRVPENAKRRRIRRSLERQYRVFKEDCLYIMLGTVDRTIDPDKVDELIDQAAFRNYFKERLFPSQDRWHVFLDKLDEAGLLRILSAVDIFRDEISFALSAIDIPSEDAFDFFKRFSGAIHSVRSTELGYDSIKPLARFLWSLFAGFDFINGYRKEDLVAKMIKSI